MTVCWDPEAGSADPACEFLDGRHFMLLAAEKISKNYSERMLLSEVSLYLNEGDKAGIIGVNGTGKSTLLRIAAGADQADSGVVMRDPAARIVYLPQNPVFDADLTVMEQVFRGAPAHEMELREYEARTILNRLGIAAHEQPVGELSGGQRKRVALASALIRPCELLILDEPTNHLDNDMVGWLEDYLIKFKGAILMVTHDRYFLDRIVNRIYELERGTLYSYEANYSKYLELKAQRLEMAAAGERKRQAVLKKELAWIQRGARARSTKSKGRIERFEALRDSEGPASAQRLEIGSLASRLGKKTIELDHIAKAYDGRSLIKDFSCIILRDARIGIVGKNGCGKSTLLNIINGTIEPDSGSVAVGDTVRTGFFSQESEEMDLSLRVIDYIRGAAENIRTEDGVLTASQMLERFLFPPDLQYNIIGRLSGGERRRLYLLRILMGAPNILLLDEPTNDLDIETLSILEDYLESFSGAVVAVSHDRYFLDRIADRIYAFEEDGEIRQYNGGFSDYLEAIPQADRQKAASPKQPAPDRAPQRQKTKFTYKEQQEFDTIDDEIAGLEAALANLEQEMAAAASDFESLGSLMERKEALEKNLEERMERWVYLHELADRLK